MKNVAIIIGVLVVVFGVGFFLTQDNDSEPSAETVPEESGEQGAAQPEVVVNGTTPEDSVTADIDTVAESASVGQYIDYDPQLVAESTADTIVLFFHASWCPSCRALEEDILTNDTTIPAGVDIYKVDYDTATELKQQYGITTQHSIVQIDSTGAAQSEVTHPATLSELLQSI